MLLLSPKHLHYPVTVIELLKKPNDPVDRFAPLFSYSYKSTVTEGNKYGDEYTIEKTYTTRYESETEGDIVGWNIGAGSVIDKAGIALVEINEPCKHETQFGGLCVICGKDMTEVNYSTTTPDSERANISMTHNNTALRVSQAEAARAESDAKKRLLESKKLSLVVDLDQTIIHATVDPTVAEWMKDPENPNYEAVKDVEYFQLLDDGPGRGCWYYIKLRPGLRAFLEKVSQLYELHIYTMGTRAYAVNIARIVDPDRKIFGDRILSRDESGSLTAKSLQRLFPTDTKMVVIIDDRGDVWNWSKNLIKVRPYDFFVGIGDINSSFLPKRDATAKDEELIEIFSNLENPAPPPTSDDLIEEKEDGGEESNGILEHTPNGELSTVDKLVSMGGSNDAAAVKERSDQQDETLAAQLADRPLLQKQKILDKAEEEAIEQAKADTSNGEIDVEELKPNPNHRQNLLQDDDNELEHLEKALQEVHRRFYEAYRQIMAPSLGGRVAELRQTKPPKKRPDDDTTIPQVQDILPNMKSNVLRHVSLVFSGVVPLGMDVRLSDIGQWAQNFGAKVELDLIEDTTHVIASKTRRTAKVRAAARNPKIKIVTTGWLLDCLTQWKMLEEKPYIIEVEPDAKDRISSQATNDSVWDAFEETLSSSESGDEAVDKDVEGTLDASSDAKSKPRLGLFTDVKTKSKINTSWEPGDKDGDEDRLSAASPVDDFDEEDWAAMDAEFDDLDDDDDDDEDNSEGWQSDASQKSDVSAIVNEVIKKRKRNTISEDGEETDTNGVEAGNAASLGSELQKRKRRAMVRSSSLNKVTTVNSIPSSTSLNSGPMGPELEWEQHLNNADNGLNDVADDAAEDTDDAAEDTDDGFDAEFEAALEAELEVGEDSADDDGG